MLSTRYSNAAVEMAQGLGRHKSTLPRVQTWFLRASWLKSEGRAIESWHALGQAIREAQEVGLHKATTVLGDQIRAEEGKRVWVNLYTWDRYVLETSPSPSRDVDTNILQVHVHNPRPSHLDQRPTLHCPPTP